MQIYNLRELVLPHDPSPECLQVQTRTARRGGRPRGHRALRAHVISDMDIDWAKSSIRDPLLLAPRMRTALYVWENEHYFFKFFCCKKHKRVNKAEICRSPRRSFFWCKKHKRVNKAEIHNFSKIKNTRTGWDLLPSGVLSVVASNHRLWIAIPIFDAATSTTFFLPKK